MPRQPVHEELDSEYPHIVREEDVPVVSKDFSENGSSEPKEVPASDPVEGEIFETGAARARIFIPYPYHIRPLN